MAWDPVWEKVFTSQSWGKYPGEDLIRFVARNFYGAPKRHARRFLEVGCGPGANLWYLAREGFAVFGIDGSPAAVNSARERLSEESPGWDAPPRDGRVEVGDILHLPVPDCTFDAALDSEAVYCNSYEHSQKIYREMYRATKRCGRLFVRTFATCSWGDGTGRPVGANAWIVDEGPLAGKGYSRFASLEDLPRLLAPWQIQEVNLITRTVEHRRHEIREWVVEAVKLDD